MGSKLKDGFNKKSEELNLKNYFWCEGYAPWTDIEVDSNDLDIENLEFKSLFQQECMKRGLLAGLYHAPCYAHNEKDIDLALKIYGEAMVSMKCLMKDENIKKHLTGDSIRPVFREKK